MQESAGSRFFRNRRIEIPNCDPLEWRDQLRNEAAEYDHFIGPAAQFFHNYWTRSDTYLSGSEKTKAVINHDRWEVKVYDMTGVVEHQLQLREEVLEAFNDADQKFLNDEVRFMEAGCVWGQTKDWVGRVPTHETTGGIFPLLIGILSALDTRLEGEIYRREKTIS